jgi:hypothetical protein
VGYEEQAAFFKEITIKRKIESMPFEAIATYEL